VDWIAGDITTINSIGEFDVWHDRAVFHFLTDKEDRKAYLRLARRTLPVGGHLILATFASDGPPCCSGLEVCRYDDGSLAAELQQGFAPIRDLRETHVTPSGTSQPFL
jgi:hypothetical protein